MKNEISNQNSRTNNKYNILILFDYNVKSNTGSFIYAKFFDSSKPEADCYNSRLQVIVGYIKYILNCQLLKLKCQLLKLINLFQMFQLSILFINFIYILLFYYVYLLISYLTKSNDLLHLLLFLTFSQIKDYLSLFVMTNSFSTMV